MTTSTTTVEPQPRLAGAYRMAQEAQALRNAGHVTKAMELEIQLAWDGRCTVCGHPLQRSDSRQAAAGRLCLRIRNHH